MNPEFPLRAAAAQATRAALEALEIATNQEGEDSLLMEATLMLDAALDKIEATLLRAYRRVSIPRLIDDAIRDIDDSRLDLPLSDRPLVDLTEEQFRVVRREFARMQHEAAHS